MEAAAAPSGRDTLADSVAIVITTSPIPSMPSTALLEALYNSLRLCPALSGCRRVLVADGIGAVAGPGQSSNYKKSKIGAEEAEAYAKYLENIQKLISSGQPGWADTEFLMLEERMGFAHALKAGAQRASSQFVMTVQHDQLLLGDFDAVGIVHAMQHSPGTLKYVGLPSRTTTVGYVERIQQRYQLDISSLRLSVHALTQPLLPLLMWYDKPHIVSLSHLLDFVFNPGASGVEIGQGQFIEDMLGHHQLKDIKANGLGAHSKYGTWVLDSDVPVTYHLSGRKVLAAEQGPMPGTAKPTVAQLNREALTGTNSGTQPFYARVPGLGFPPEGTDKAGVNSGPFQPGTAALTAPSYKFRGLCFWCNQKGHSFRFCPNKEKGADVDTGADV